jgi:hypothetical protein
MPCKLLSYWARVSDSLDQAMDNLWRWEQIKVSQKNVVHVLFFPWTKFNLEKLYMRAEVEEKGSKNDKGAQGERI